MLITRFTFNPFAENTYLLSDQSGECVVVDPGMSTEVEDKVLFDFIEKEGLLPVLVINTHCHLDHILGNASTCKRYNIDLIAHRLDLPMLAHAPAASLMYGVDYHESPDPTRFVEEGEQVKFGRTTLEVLFVPGHAPGHIALINHAGRLILGGDVLFKGSVGRTDLPMGNATELVNSIQEKLYRLPEDYIVYPGHGEHTTIGDEKRNNAFVREGWSLMI